MVMFNSYVKLPEGNSKAPQFRLQLSLQLIHPFFQLFHLEKINIFRGEVEALRLHQTTVDSTKRWSETLWHYSLGTGNS